MSNAKVDLVVANLLKQEQELRAVEACAQAWKLACAEFERLVGNYSQFEKMDNGEAEEKAFTFLHKFEELKVLYGDPNKTTPLGDIHAKRP